MNKGLHSRRLVITIAPILLWALGPSGCIWHDTNKPVAPAVLVKRSREPPAPSYAVSLAQANEMTHTHPGPKAYYYLGLAYYKLGEYPLAIPSFQQALRAAPHFLGARFYLACSYDAIGSYTQALSELKIIANEHRVPSYNLAQVYLHEGIVYSELHNDARAQEAYSQSLVYNPHEAEAYYGIALIAGRKGKYDNARKYLQVALRNTQDKSLSAALHEALGELDDDSNDHVAAQREYKIALGLDPNNSLAKEHIQGAR